MLPPRPRWRKGDKLRRDVSNAAFWLAAAALASSPAALSACGSSGLDDTLEADLEAPRQIDTSTGPRPLPLAQFPARLAEALCRALDQCCQAGGFASQGVDACSTRARVDYEQQVAATSALAVRYDALAAARCVAAFGAFVSSCSYEGRAASDAACRAVFKGTLPVAQPCESDSECVSAGSEAYCAGSLGPNAHSCQLARADGESCLLEGCAHGSFCDLDTLTCAPQRSSGACLQFEACDADSACAPSGLCEPKLAAGQRCQLGLQCTSAICGEDGLCAGAIASASACAGG